MSFQNIKRQELFTLLHCYYPVTELYNLFYAVIGKDDHFKDFVLEHYTEVRDVKEFAALASLSLSTFRRRFLEEFQCSAGEWLKQRLTERVHRELLTTNKSISAIAADLNFSSEAYFTTFCRRNFGMPPTRLRNSRQRFAVSSQIYHSRESGGGMRPLRPLPDVVTMPQSSRRIQNQ